jgi:hypothetical protein
MKKVIYFLVLSALITGLNAQNICHTTAYQFKEDTIRRDLTWNTPTLVLDEVVIPSGVSLTITTEVYFTPNGAITILPNGKLYLTKATLTSDCKELWKGITVDGTSNIQDDNLQGYLKMEYSIIENAVCAVKTTHIAKRTGGIVYADNVEFRNNVCAINYGRYAYSDIFGNIANNKGRFDSCKFIVDDNNYFGTNGQGFENHVSLNGVKGIKFYGCEFGYKGENKEGIGIYATGSGFYVASCEPPIATPSSSDIDCLCEKPVRNVFYGLRTGIAATNSGETYAVVIDNSIFENNSEGVNIEGIHNFRVTRNRFSYFDSRALYSECASGYRIEENLLHTISSGNKTQYGMIIKESGPGENVIYNNTFENVPWFGAIRAVGTNGTTSSVSGLQFICNTFVRNYNDIIARDSSDIIRPNQGNEKEGADNTFGGAIHNNLEITSGQKINYYCSPGYEPQKYPSNVTVIDNVDPNTCASKLCNYGKGATNTSMQELLDYYIKLQNEYNVLLNDFENGKSSEDIMIDILSNKMREVSDGAISSIMQDDILDFNMLKSWFETVNTPVSKYSLVEAHLQTNDYKLADAVLNGIPAMFDFSDREFAEYNNYIKFYELKKQLQLEEREWNELSEIEISFLQSIAEAKTGRASTMAKGILCFFYKICYKENFDVPFEDPSLNPKLKEINPEIIISDTKITATVEDVEKIEVYDTAGRLIQLIKGKKQLDIFPLPSGTYIVKIYTKDLNVSSYKFIKP